ncbi:hypothetical protein [Sphingosinicella sp. BN140058]|uniref:DUF6894 family protein n=1 Tax=Sphingosinicella sp. BN140058 TaxID=1892855 RepID=UPI001013B709|nr:hypothetical protein [Sphingosinicella sp. BN140058]QAY75688.1 hypothetical protein ETR14_03450 [Sphingosinicella sp. BN140058]
MMPAFYFHLRGDEYHVPDLTGQEWPDEMEARREAERLAAELVDTARLAGGLPRGGTIEVLDADQRPILTLPLQSGERK